MGGTVPQLSPENFAKAFADIHPPFEPQAATVEANRCLFCFDAPCTAACPTHIDVPRFIKKISTRNLRGSAMTILESNILGLSCSRVCPVIFFRNSACSACLAQRIAAPRGRRREPARQAAAAGRFRRSADDHSRCPARRRQGDQRRASNAQELNASGEQRATAIYNTSRQASASWRC